MNRLRRDKLHWCAKNNKKMQRYSKTPVQYLVLNMPQYLKACHNEVSNATQNLNQYLSSPKANYWQSRPQTINELCQALCLPASIWNLADLDSFIVSAKAQYQQLKILVETIEPDYQFIEPMLPRLHTLKIKDGKNIITFDVVCAEKTLGFRRKSKISNDIVLHPEDEVRISICTKDEGYALLFLIDPANQCKVIAPTIYQTNTRFNDGVFYVPPLQEDRFYPPPQSGCYQLYALTAPKKLALFDNDDGEHPITPKQFEQLLNFCCESLEHSGHLYRTDFYVKP